MKAATREEDPHLSLSNKFAALHWQSLGEGEFSRKLGPEAVRVFYNLLLNSAFGRVFHSETASGDILSLCCVFTDYDAFSRTLSKKLVPIVLTRVLLGKLSPLVLLQEGLRRKKDLPGDLRKFHLGMIVRNAEYGPIATRKLMENLRDALAYLGDLGVKELWASSLRTNHASIMFLARNGFTEYRSHSDIVFLTYSIKR